MAYQPGKWVRQKNKDNKWFEFVLQKKGNSCGPACVLILKQLYSPGAKYQISEGQIRGATALAETNQLNSGISTIGGVAKAAHDWQNNGSDPTPLVKVLKSNPVQIPTARTVSGTSSEMLEYLRKCSPKRPAIVGWWWGKKGTYNAGGHWTVCVGPTSDGRDLTILDPWNGIQYIGNHKSSCCSYQVHEDDGSISATGWFNPNDPADAAVIVTY